MSQQHGEVIESWTIHEVRIICPKCRRMLYLGANYYNTIFTDLHCHCGRSYKIQWEDKTKDAVVTVHTYVDIDLPIPDHDNE